VTLLKDSVTEIVNLGGIADLPVESDVENQWNPVEALQ